MMCGRGKSDPVIVGGSRMRESCTYGSVRGARGNSRPYRDRREFIALLAGGTMWPLGAEGIRDAACRFSASPSNFAGALWSVKFAILLAFQTGYAGREIPANPTSQSIAPTDFDNDQIAM